VSMSLTVLGTLLLAASLAPPATAEHSCRHILAILEGEEPRPPVGELTSDELLACGLSPEAIDPCEGGPSGPSLDECRARTGTTVEDFPSISEAAGVGTAVGYPPPGVGAPSFASAAGAQTSSSSVSASASASAAGASATAGAPAVTIGAASSVSLSASASAGASATATASATALAETGGPSHLPALASAAALALVVSGLVALGLVVRRGNTRGQPL
jgi:hypothetical protein